MSDSERSDQEPDTSSNNTIYYTNTFEASGNVETPERLRPPKYTVDLSLPPEQRYLHIVPDFLPDITPLPALLDVIYDCIPYVPNPLLRLLTRAVFRRVYDNEENRELRGLAKALGLQFYLLVALNGFLDLLMGCTSGGVRVRKESGRGSKVLHFRTLDWTMDPLRKLVMEVDFIDKPGGEVIYSCITYFGYVGVLTAWKKGLSLSLNFRPKHDKSTIKKRLAFRWHQILLGLGKRKGIASEMRAIMEDREPRTSRVIAESLKDKASTAAYITICDGQTTLVLENDNRSGLIREDKDFIVAVNHDIVDGQRNAQQIKDECKSLDKCSAMDWILLMSTDRQESITELWSEDRTEMKSGYAVKQDEVIQWMEECEEISNEETHYGVIMDPTEGKLIWVQRYLEPLVWSNDTGYAEELNTPIERAVYRTFVKGESTAESEKTVPQIDVPQDGILTVQPSNRSSSSTP